MSELQEPGKRKNMKIKSKAAVKTVTAKKTRTTVKKAAPKAAAKPVEKSVTFTVRAEPGKAVYLAGTFNNWDPTGKKMQEKKDGVYSVAPSSSSPARTSTSS